MYWIRVPLTRYKLRSNKTRVIKSFDLSLALTDLKKSLDLEKKIESYQEKFHN